MCNKQATTFLQSKIVLSNVICFCNAHGEIVLQHFETHNNIISKHYFNKLKKLEVIT